LLEPRHLHINRRAALDGLVDHAVTLGQFEQLIESVLGCVGVEIETQTDLRARLAAAEQQAADLSNEVAVTHANLEEAFRTIANQLSRIKALGGQP